jgi:hypothetical protein
MTVGARAALFCVALAAAIVFAAGSRIAAAQASGPPQPADLAAEITAYTNSQVDAAMAEANAVSSQVAGVQLSVPSPASTVAGQAPAPTAQNAAPSSASPIDPVIVVSADPVEVLAVSPQPIPLAPPIDVAGSLPGAGPVAQHDLERSVQRPKGVIRTSRSIVSRSSSLRVELRTSATEETSSSSAHTMAQATVHSSVKSTASGGRSQPPADPRAPLPFPPLAPNAPAPPSSGVSSTGGGGGQGALLLFFVPVAALVLFGIHRLLRKVHWSGLRMPRRGAVLPWRPG